MTNEFNIEIEYRHVPRLNPGSDESIAYLDEHGYAVIKNALSGELFSRKFTKFFLMFNTLKLLLIKSIKCIPITS